MDDKLTIVGPGPSGGKQSAPARVNIEALLLMAKYNDGFRDLLLSDRPRALAESGIAFSGPELRLLASVPRGKLESSIDEFSISGVTRESLASWKEAAAIIMLVMTVLVGSSCQDAPAVKGIIPDRRPKDCVELRDVDIDNFHDGWCDPDTFRLITQGVSPAKEIDIEKRRDKSRQAAVLNAKYRILEKFIGARIEAGGLVSDDYRNPSLDAYKAEVKDIIGKGTVIAEKWDDAQACTVIFQIRRPGLRRWAESGF
jgi:hypothetical protein